MLDLSGETMSVIDLKFNEIKRVATHLKLAGGPPSPPEASLAASSAQSAARQGIRPGSLSLPPPPVSAERAKRTASEDAASGADRSSLHDLTSERDRLEREVTPSLNFK